LKFSSSDELLELLELPLEPDPLPPLSSSLPDEDCPPPEVLVFTPIDDYFDGRVKFDDSRFDFAFFIFLFSVVIELRFTIGPFYYNSFYGY